MWGDSAWDLIELALQIAMLLLTGYMLASTPLVDRGLNALSRRISRPRTAIALVTFPGALGTWLNVGFGLVIGVVLARKLARTIATPGHLLEDRMGIVPTSETVFDPIVLATSAVVILVMPLFLTWLHPTDASEAVTHTPSDDGSDTEGARRDPEAHGTLADRLNASPFVGIALGLLGVLYTVLYFSGGGGLDFNIINLAFLALALLLFARPNDFLRALQNSIGVVSGVLVQYPIYAGIMGVLAGSGLMVTLAGIFVSVSSPETLPFFSFLSGGLINLFAPSGGARWAVQGPIMIEAAQQIGADPTSTALGVAYGDMWSNAIQPFWIIPVLAISGIRLRDVMGYLFLVLVFLGVVYSASILLLGFR